VNRESAFRLNRLIRLSRLTEYKYIRYTEHFKR